MFTIYTLILAYIFLCFPSIMIVEMLNDQFRKNIMEKTVSKTAKLHIGERDYLPWFIAELFFELI